MCPCFFLLPISLSSRILRHGLKKVFDIIIIINNTYQHCLEELGLNNMMAVVDVSNTESDLTFNLPSTADSLA